MTIQDIQNAVNGIVQKFQGNQAPPPGQAPYISPISSPDVQTPGMIYYQQYNDAMEKAAHQANTANNANTQNTTAQAAPVAQQAPTQILQQNPIQQALSQLVNPNKGQQQKAQAQSNGDNYQEKAAQIFEKTGVPPEVGLGIWAMEGRGKTINPNNPYNLGAYDSNPQNANAYKFSDPLEGTKAAADFLAGKSPYQDKNVSQIFQQALSDYKKTKDPVGYLKQISGVYSTNPNYWKTIIQTPEFQKFASQ